LVINTLKSIFNMAARASLSYRRLPYCCDLRVIDFMYAWTIYLQKICHNKSPKFFITIKSNIIAKKTLLTINKNTILKLNFVLPGNILYHVGT